jgi:DNA-binding transcriptional LysR family regulator
MFLIAAQETAFAPAAARLSISPSAVSHAMKSLEDELNCRLFRRAGPKVTLTGAGWRLLPLVEDLMERMSSIAQEMTALADHADRLRVVVPRAWCGSLLPKVLPELYECYPKVHLEILTSEDIPEADREGLIDLTIGDGEDAPPSAVHRQLFNEVLGLYVAPFDRLHLRSPLEIGDVAGNLILISDSSARHRVINHMNAGAPRAVRTWLLPGIESVIEMARVGHGVAVLPEWAALHAVSKGALVPLKLSGPHLARTCCAWWNINRPPSWTAEVFLNLVMTAWAEHSTSPGTD